MRERTRLHIDAHLSTGAAVIGKHMLAAEYSTHVLQFDGIAIYIEAKDFDVFVAKLMLALSMSAADAQDNYRKAAAAKFIQEAAAYQQEPDGCTCDGEDICEPCQKAMADDYASNLARE